MGKVEDCVSRVLSGKLSEGEEPTDQDLAIAFSECRDDHPGGDAGFGETLSQEGLLTVEAECPPGHHFCEEEGKCMPMSDEIDEESVQENADINGSLAQAMHEQQFGEKLIDQESFVEMVNSSKYLSAENKDSVLGMAFNYYEKIFFHDEVEKGASFDNVTTQEFLTVVNEVMQAYPHIDITKEFLARKMTERGLDAMMVYEFVRDQLTIEERDRPDEKWPNVTSIFPNSEIGHHDSGMTVPNINAEDDFKPDDILFGGEPREDVSESKKKRQ